MNFEKPTIIFSSNGFRCYSKKKDMPKVFAALRGEL